MIKAMPICPKHTSSTPACKIKVKIKLVSGYVWLPESPSASMPSRCLSTDCVAVLEEVPADFNQTEYRAKSAL